MLEVPVKFSI